MEAVVWMGRDQRLGRMYTYRGRSEAGKIYQSGPSIPPDFGGYGPPCNLPCIDLHCPPLPCPTMTMVLAYEQILKPSVAKPRSSQQKFY